MNRTPSAAQLRCAYRIKETLGIPLPESYTRQAYWKFIKEHMEDYKSVDDRGDTINGKSGVAEIVISFGKIPAHCGECRLYIENEYFDEDAFFGDGITHSCPFGCQQFGCLVQRPPDCPIIPKTRGDT